MPMWRHACILRIFAAVSVAAFLLLLVHENAHSRAGRSGGSSGRSYRSSSSRSSHSSSSYRSSSYRSGSYGSSYGGYRRSYGTSYGRSGYYSRGSGSWVVSLVIILITIAVIGFIFLLSRAKNSADHGGYSSFSGSTGGYGGTVPRSPYGGASPFGRSGGNAGDPALVARVREVFMKVQEAWMERDQYIARDFMSDNLFEEHRSETDAMIEERKKNVLRDIRIHEVRIIDIRDDQAGADDSLEPSGGYGRSGHGVPRLSASITASMIDYVIDEDSGRVIDGDAEYRDEFTEVWKFVKNFNGWVADEIESR